MARLYVDKILEARRSEARSDRIILNGEPLKDQRALYAAYQFVAGGMRSIFLQDGNSLIIKPDDIIRILNHLKQKFPIVERVTSYARSHTIAKISDDHLKQMAEAGLNRIHIGLESGSDRVLKMVKKGVDKATQILAGQKVKHAGMELSEYYIPGLGGSTLSQENAIETADALNQIDPDFIRLRTLALPSMAPLTAQFIDGKFDKQGEVGTIGELLLFLESLGGITSTVRSDHTLNLFPEVDGVLPDDRERMIQPLKDFLALDQQGQMIFCIGRRTHRISRLEDLNNQAQRDSVLQICEQLGVTVENMDQIINSIMQRFV
jgi:hypothetical protein